jgi:hypothetical protein
VFEVSQVSEARPHPSDEDLSLVTPRPGTPAFVDASHSVISCVAI